MATRQSHAAGRKGDDRPTSNQLKEFRQQVSRGQISKMALQVLLTTQGDPLRKFETKPLTDADCEVFERYTSFSSSCLVDCLDASEISFTDYESPAQLLLHPIRAFFPEYSIRLAKSYIDVKYRAMTSVFWRQNHISSVFPAPIDSIHRVALNENLPVFDVLQHAWEHPVKDDPWWKTCLKGCDPMCLEFAADVYNHFANDRHEGQVWDVLERAFNHENEMDKWDSGHDWRYAFMVTCQDNLATALQASLALWMKGDGLHVHMLRPYLALFLEGIIPLGYDAEDRLVIITA